MEKIVILLSRKDFKSRGFYSKVLDIIKKRDIKIISKNCSTISTEKTMFIFKWINLNRANDLVKHKDNLILYVEDNDSVFKEIIELKSRCSVKLKVRRIYNINSISLYLGEMECKRYVIFKNSVSETTVLLTKKESNRKSILINDKVYYLNKKDAEDELSLRNETEIALIKKEIIESENKIIEYSNSIKNETNILTEKRNKLIQLLEKR